MQNHDPQNYYTKQKKMIMQFRNKEAMHRHEECNRDVRVINVHLKSILTTATGTFVHCYTENK